MMIAIKGNIIGIETHLCTQYFCHYSQKVIQYYTHIQTQNTTSIRKINKYRTHKKIPQIQNGFLLDTMGSLLYIKPFCNDSIE